MNKVSDLAVGIDAMSFYTSHYYLDLADLASARNIDVDKFHVGLGQFKMAMAAPGEDVVTMAANATKQVLQYADINEIDTILFATESGIDQSKAAGIYLHSLLNLPKQCRVIELKQACYSTTAGLQLAMALVTRYPQKKVLLVASDIARYGLNQAGESSQGCGAVAMLISVNPRMLTIEPEYSVYTDDVMDFWRPNYKDVAFVEGKYSAIIYMRALEQVWRDYKECSQRGFSDHAFYCYHAPVPRLVEKAHKILAKINGEKLSEEQIKQQTADSLVYARDIGNSYTAALHIALISLLDNYRNDLTGQRIGFYSYGSGCVAEYFSGVMQKDYQNMLQIEDNQKMLTSRQALSYEEYEKFFNFVLPEDGSEFYIPRHDTGHFRLAGIKNHKRLYEICDT
jgi:hydroxymethylglutaryl-CoA synthase